MLLALPSLVVTKTQRRSASLKPASSFKPRKAPATRQHTQPPVPGHRRQVASIGLGQNPAIWTTSHRNLPKKRHPQKNICGKDVVTFCCFYTRPILGNWWKSLLWNTIQQQIVDSVYSKASTVLREIPWCGCYLRWSLRWMAIPVTRNSAENLTPQAATKGFRESDNFIISST